VAVPDLDLEHVCDHVALSDALSGLDERTRQVLRLRFVEEKTQRRIAEQLGASQMQVSRLLKRTLENLRECLGDEENDLPAAGL
jgi:RNA polymerase sigma-B factor